MTKTYIEKLHVKKMRQFNELNVEFGEKFNFIAGPNGCGKTSILACISHCLDHNNFSYSRFSEDSEFWTDIRIRDFRYRAGLGPKSLRGDSYRAARLDNWNFPQNEDGRQSLFPYQIKDLSIFCPLFIGANRSIKYKQISGMQREKDHAQHIQNFLNQSTRSLYGDWSFDIKQWLINRYFIVDKEWAREERVNWALLLDSLPNIGPFDSKFSFVRIGRDLEPIFSIYGKECYLEELSSGFQAVLFIIANIFEWIEGSKKESDRNAIEATGTVLIDELDLHLHPEWQFTLRDGLESIFPKLQFIVTTHSPHLLASAKPNEVIVMPKNCYADTYNLFPSSKTFSGWNTDQILSDVMDVKSLENKEHQRLISEALVHIENRSVSELENTINKLRDICHPSDTIVTVLSAKLASMVALKDD